MRRRTRVASVGGLALVACIAAVAAGQSLSLGAPAPEIAGAPWINSGPLTIAALRGVRHRHIGEGGHADSEAMIQRLLAERG